MCVCVCVCVFGVGFSYWMDGEPNDDYGYEDCVATYPTVNPLKSWNDVPCRHPLKWICAKGPQPVAASLES